MSWKIGCDTAPFIYANNEPKSALARDLGDCRDNKGKLAKRVFTCFTSVTVQSFPYRNFHRQLLPDVWPPTCKLWDQLHPLDPSGWIVTHILFLHVTNIKSMNLKTHQEVLQ